MTGFDSKRQASKDLLQPAMPNPWRDAIDGELVCLHLGTADSFLDARAALNAVVNWHVETALDPEVSAYAQALIDRGAAAPVPAVPPDTGQILYALDRQIAALDAHALRLQAVGDYSAEFPAEDADRLREAKAMLAAAPVPQAEPEPAMWQQRWTNPGVNPDVWPEEVDWKPLDLKGRTEADTLRDLVAYTFDGRPCYEVRALYTHPAAPVPAVQSAARAIADEQSYDTGLWFVATTVTEAHLQAALRRLTAAVEGEAP